MDFDRRQLLCTFSSLNEYQNDITKICNVYAISGGKIYVLQSASDTNDVFLTYNVIRGESRIKFPKTILVHRKRDFNVIYSINALNIMVEELRRNGKSEYDISCKKYQSSVVIAHEDSIKVIPTKLLGIQRISQ